jgi:glycosyltransferase involved in cell wall biosynthesis
MRLAYDLSILRHPPAGTARYATELLRAMRVIAGSDEIDETMGWPRGPRGGSVRRIWNLGSDLGWLTVGAAAVAARRRSDAWFSPANVLPLALPRPKIVSILDTNVVTARDQYDRAYAAYATRMFRSAGRRADAVLTLSSDSRRRLIDLLGLPPGRIVVAYPGIDHALRIEPGPRIAGLPASYALFVGQTEPHKNVERLVAAWDLDVPRDLVLVIAGPPGRDEPRLTELIAGSPARARIHRLGRVSEDSLARLFADATCFVFPSLAEGFGLPPLEAMARGVPTAVADAGALPEVTADGAIRFDPLRPEAIAEAVTRLVEDTALRTRLTVAGPAVAGRYRWVDTAETAWRVVRSVAHG